MTDFTDSSRGHVRGMYTLNRRAPKGLQNPHDKQNPQGKQGKQGKRGSNKRHPIVSHAEARRSLVAVPMSVTRASHNEDSLVVMPPLFAVADGMGGHEAGEVASEIAIETVSELAPKHPDADTFTHAVQAANLNVLKAPSKGIGREGMGTTFTGAILEGERLLVAQVGDSRAYLLHQGRLQQITRDHSLMADLIEIGQITPAEARVQS